MAKVRVDRDGVLLALNSMLDEVDWYVDLETGDVIPHDTTGDRDEAPDPAAEPARYQQLEPLSAQRAWQLRAEFAERVVDAALRRRLQAALDGPGAFRRFRHALAADPAEAERWSRFEEERLLEEARTQLREDGIEATFTDPG